MNCTVFRDPDMYIGEVIFFSKNDIIQVAETSIRR